MSRVPNKKHEKSQPKEVIPSRFSFLKSCKHDTQAATNCTFCKLVRASTKEYFRREEEENTQSRMKSLATRAQMRLGLMFNWSRCQLSFIPVFPSFQSFEMTFSKSLADLILDENTMRVVKLEDIFKLLNLKNRIREVGYFTAVYLQARIRKYLTKRRLRRMLLKRFEYVPATRRKAEYYIDKDKLRKLNKYPSLINKDRPATPRTINRRLAAENKKRDMHYQRYQISVSNMPMNDFFHRDEIRVNTLKQYVIFRDLIAMAMIKLKTQRMESLTTAISNANNPSYSTGPNNNNKNQALVAQQQQLLSDLTESKEWLPIWIALSPPASTYRQLGLSFALSTPSPSSILNNTSNSLSEGNTTASTTSASSLNKAIQIMEQIAWDSLQCRTPEDVVNKVLQMEDLIPVLESVSNISEDEHFIWHGQLHNKEAAALSAPNGVIHNNNNNISYNNSNAIVPRGGSNSSNNSNVTTPVMTSRVGSADIADGSGSRSSAVTPMVNNFMSVGPVTTPSILTSSMSQKRFSAFPYEVLPMSLQLFPIIPDHTPNGMFRLFFYDEEFIAATQVSPWAYYPELFRNRDSIVLSLRNFANLPSTKMLVKQCQARANVSDHHHTAGSSSGNNNSGITPSNRRGSNPGDSSMNNSNTTGATPTSRRNSNVNSTNLNRTALNNAATKTAAKADKNHHPNSLFTPPEMLLFNQITKSLMDDEPYNEYTISDEKALYLYNKYRFLSKLDLFNNRAYVAYENEQKKKQEAENKKNKKGGVTAATTTTSTNPAEGLTVTISHSTSNDVNDGNNNYANAIDTHEHLMKTQLKLLKLNNKTNVDFTENEVEYKLWLDSQSVLLGVDVDKLLHGGFTSDLDMNKYHIRNNSNNNAKNNKYNNNNNKLKQIKNTDDSDEDDDKAAEQTLEPYAQKLLDFSTLVSSDIKQRINYHGEVKPPHLPTYQLVVLDVFINIPKPPSKAPPPTAASAMGNRNMSSLSGISGGGSNNNNVPDTARSDAQQPGMNTARSAASSNVTSSNTNTMFGGGAGGADKKVVAEVLPVDLHQVVGIFACSQSKAPPNIDCGLFQWELFHQIYRERAGNRLGSATSNMIRSNMMNNSSATGGSSVSSGGGTGGPGGGGKERISWTAPDSNTGVAMHKFLLPSGREYQLLLLGAIPSKDYLQQSMPKKVKTWLGIAV